MLNVVVIEGRATKDPELTRAASNGTAIATLTLAVDTLASKNGNGKAVFLTVKLFGERGEKAARMISKGEAIVVTGKLDCFETKDGRQVIYLNANDFQFPSINKPKGAAPEVPGALSTPTYQEKPAPAAHKEPYASGFEGIDILNDDTPF